MPLEAFKRLFGEGSAPADDEGGEMSGTDDGEPEPEPQPVDPAGDLGLRLDELETELDRNESSIRAIASSQEEMTEAVEEINDTVRRLLGVYDRLAATDNPFVDDRADRGRFGIVGAPDGAAPAAPPRDDGAESERAADSTGAVKSSPADSEAVSFDDLLADRATEAPEAAESRPEPPEEMSALPPGQDGASPSAGGTGAAPASTRDDSGDPAGRKWPTLSTLPDGYAADGLVLEWLAGLVEAAGPAGALKALAYYERVGWIEGEVKDRLEDYLGGPDLDVHVDPSRPNELTAADHAESYERVLTLRALSAMD